MFPSHTHSFLSYILHLYTAHLHVITRLNVRCSGGWVFCPKLHTEPPDFTIVCSLMTKSILCIWPIAHEIHPSEGAAMLSCLESRQGIGLSRGHNIRWGVGGGIYPVTCTSWLSYHFTTGAGRKPWGLKSRKKTGLMFDSPKIGLIYINVFKMLFKGLFKLILTVSCVFKDQY